MIGGVIKNVKTHRSTSIFQTIKLLMAQLFLLMVNIELCMYNFGMIAADRINLWYACLPPEYLFGDAVYPTKYTLGCVVVMLSFYVDSHNSLTYVLQRFVTGIMVTSLLPQCLWIILEDTRKFNRYLIITKFKPSVYFLRCILSMTLSPVALTIRIKAALKSDMWGIMFD